MADDKRPSRHRRATALQPAARRFRMHTARNLDELPQLASVPAERRAQMRAVATVLPFRVSSYVVDELIDWSAIPDDPIFQMTFPQAGMLRPLDMADMRDHMRRGVSKTTLRAAADAIRKRLNPQPAAQMELNRPMVDGRPLAGVQHKYRETVLYFPSPGQTCHSYCTYCFRWAQFVGMRELKMESHQIATLVRYLRVRPEVRNVLITGGDPMIMKARNLRRIVEPLLVPELEHIHTIRIGSKTLSFWPYRFLTDADADDLLRLFEEVQSTGRQLAFMAHFTHPRELETLAVQRALSRIRATGAVVRCQAPLLRHINDDADVWAALWRAQVALGLVPYYMFVARDTGAQHYFSVPLVRAQRIFSDALRQVSGLARTVRGPSMSTTPGKVCVEGMARIEGIEVMVLRFLQARNPDWVGRTFFARRDDQATWLDELRPAFGDSSFFFRNEAPEPLASFLATSPKEYARPRLAGVNGSATPLITLHEVLNRPSPDTANAPT